MCPLYPKNCNYVEKTKFLPRYCSRHKNSIVELQVFETSSSGEKRHFIRCKESKNESRKFCETIISKNEIPLSSKTKSSSLEGEISTVKELLNSDYSNENIKLKQITEVQSNAIPFHGNDYNTSFRNPTTELSSSSDDDSSDERDNNHHKTVPNEKLKYPISSKDSISSEDLLRLENELDKRKKIYQVANVNALPDKGARLKDAIEKLESKINDLKLSEKKQSITQDRKLETIEKSQQLRKQLERTENEEQTIKIKENPSKNLEDKQENFSWKSYLIQFVNSHEMKIRIKNVMLELEKSLESCPKDDDFADDPKGLLLPLLPHQKYALSWLLWREHHYPHGGILADDMGLGKTMTMISLIMKQKEMKFQEKETNSEHPQLNPTLIICPASIIHQWNNEISKHCKNKTVCVHIYHGSDRIKSIERLLEYDVIITTYDTLCSDVKSDIKKASNKDDKLLIKKKPYEKSPLLCIQWERIILDEAHKIKNPNTMTAQAVYSLKTSYHWAVTGTPIHNNLSDLYSLMKFINFFPFNESSLWKKCIEIKSDSSNNLIKVLMKFILLRRLKNQTDKWGNCLVKLPPKEIITVNLQLSDKEREVYDRLFKICQSTMTTYLQEEKSKKNNSDVLSEKSKQNRTDNSKIEVNRSFMLVMLLRLQQCCCHLSLLQKAAKNELFYDDNEKEKEMFQQMEALSLNEEIKSTVSNDSALNNMFKRINEKFLFNNSESKNQNLENFKADAPSTKILNILKELNNIKMQSKDGIMEKCVFVSQWVSMLEIVAEHINKAGFRYSIIKGDVNVETRMKIVDDFNNNPQGTEVMLLSLKAGGVGLNLIGGNHLFILDIHWNPALESQACDRIYRLGQKKKVFIHKFICTGTIEENIVLMQKAKMNLADNVLSTNTTSKLTLKDFYNLFQVC